MNRLTMIMLTSLVVVGPVFAGSTPPIPAPEPNFTDPGTPEQRKAYKIAVLENEIVQDQWVLDHPGGGKGIDVQDRAKVAKEDLKNNQVVLEKIKNGADMEVYFCSKCGRERMKEGTCPHCKIALVPLFDPHKGNPRPSSVLETN